MIRRWRLWEPSCTEDGQGVVIPSAQLLIASIARADNKSNELFEKHIRPVLIEECQRCHGEKKQQGVIGFARLLDAEARGDRDEEQQRR